MRTAALLLALVLTGCGPSVTYVPVTGEVLIGGKPAAGVRVEFHPDPDHDNSGPSSFAETDDQGRFRLECSDPKTNKVQAGAVAGWHRVILLDIAASKSGGRADSQRIRVGPEYGKIEGTPLILEVQIGSPNMTIKIPERP